MTPATSYGIGAAIAVLFLSLLAHQHDRPAVAVAGDLHPQREGANSSAVTHDPAELSWRRPSSASNRPDPRRQPAPRPASRSSVRTAPASPPSPARPGGPTAAQWAQLRDCEASGDYTTDTGNGYYGAYQFDLGTWASVGGEGNPAGAPPAEQDARARALYAERGDAPWPTCGVFLR